MADKTPVTPVVANFTTRISGRAGDMLFWIRPTLEGMLSGQAGVSLRDLWCMKDSSHALVTNRSVDLPEWFELHPTEASGPLAYRVLERIQSGWQPGEPVEAPHLWKVCAGDRIVLCGTSRPGLTATPDGILMLLDFRENALVVTDVSLASLEDIFALGMPSDRNLAPDEVQLGQAAVRAVRALGTPRTVAREWSLDR